MKGRTRRQYLWGWLLMAAVVVTVVITSGSRPPTEGVGDDRLFHIASQLKCVQCVGESVAGSSAPIAEQFRAEIRTQMGEGRTDGEILDYFASHYDDVLLNPPATGIGSLVWIVPVVVIVFAVAALALAMDRWSRRGLGEEVTEEDERLVAEALGSSSGSAGFDTSLPVGRDD